MPSAWQKANALTIVTWLFPGKVNSRLSLRAHFWKQTVAAPSMACGYLSPGSKPQAALGTLHYIHSSNKTALNIPLTEPRSLMEKTTHIPQPSCSDQNRPARRRQGHQNSDPQEGGLSTSTSLLECFSSQGLRLSFRHMWINWCGTVWWYSPILQKKKKKEFFLIMLIIKVHAHIENWGLHKPETITTLLIGYIPI